MYDLHTAPKTRGIGKTGKIVFAVRLHYIRSLLARFRLAVEYVKGANCACRILARTARPLLWILPGVGRDLSCSGRSAFIPQALLLALLAPQ